MNPVRRTAKLGSPTRHGRRGRIALAVSVTAIIGLWGTMGAGPGSGAASKSPSATATRGVKATRPPAKTTRPPAKTTPVKATAAAPTTAGVKLAGTTWWDRVVTGTPMRADSLGRLQVTGHSEVRELWTAPTSGVITHFSAFFIANPTVVADLGRFDPATGTYPDCPCSEDDVYAAGDAGVVVELRRADANANPVGNVIASFIKDDFLSDARVIQHPTGGPEADLTNGSYLSWLPLSSPVTVTKGERFVFWFRAMDDADRLGHIYALDFMSTRFVRGPGAEPIDYEILPRTERDVLFRATSGPHSTGGAWRSSGAMAQGGPPLWGSSSPDYRVAPMIRVRYADGFVDAPVWANNFPLGASRYGLYHVGPPPPGYPGAAPRFSHRLRFRPRDGMGPATGPVASNGASVSVIPQVPGDAVLSLRRSSDGGLVEAATSTVRFAMPPPLTNASCSPASGPTFVDAENSYGTPIAPPLTCANNSIVLLATWPTVTLQPGTEYYLLLESLGPARYQPAGGFTFAAWADSIPRGDATVWEFGSPETRWQTVGDTAVMKAAVLRTPPPLP